jgi:hypothetical protein
VNAKKRPSVTKRKDRPSEEKDRPRDEKDRLVKKRSSRDEKDLLVKKKTVPATKTHKNRPFEEKIVKSTHERKSLPQDCVKRVTTNL